MLDVDRPGQQSLNLRTLFTQILAIEVLESVQAGIEATLTGAGATTATQRDYRGR